MTMIPISSKIFPLTFSEMKTSCERNRKCILRRYNALMCSMEDIHFIGTKMENHMLNNIVLKTWTNLQLRKFYKEERGITAIEYAIIGVAMASALFFIFDKGGFLTTLSSAWSTMSTKILGAQSILK